MSTRDAFEKTYEGKSLFSDPIHGFIEFTSPRGGTLSEATEQDLIDSPWMQRLRRVYQLQSARWVFPTAEHSRFQHSLGTMHMAGVFARHLYPSLEAVCRDCPSPFYVEELLRITGLLHDIGHGPFGHFFDDTVLSQFSLTHEIIGQRIVLDKLGEAIAHIRRSPSGPLAKGEALDPAHVAYLIKKPPAAGDEKGHPKWLRFLKLVFSGVYTADNMDYVNRDSYMCGVALGPVDARRLMYYTFYSEKGLTLHRKGMGSLQMFLLSRLYLYSNIYYHRTIRAIDLQLEEIFPDTIAQIVPGNPLENLDDYLTMDEWHLFAHVLSWKGNKGIRGRLYLAWQNIIRRRLKWKMLAEQSFSFHEAQGLGLIELAAARGLESKLRESCDDGEFRVDMATTDARPLNPLASPRRICVYDENKQRVSEDAIVKVFREIPARLIHLRVFSTRKKHAPAVAQKLDAWLSAREAIPTSV